VVVEAAMESPMLKGFLEEGVRLETSILSFLEQWPRDDSGNALYWGDTPIAHQETGRELVIQTRRWFNSISLVIGPLILHDRSVLYYTLRQVEASIRKHQYQKPSNEQPVPLSVAGGNAAAPPVSPQRRYDQDVETRLGVAKGDARRGIHLALDLIKSVPSVQYQLAAAHASHQQPASSPQAFQPNTAFILMSMDKTSHDLDDVLDGIKMVCSTFGIQASRADDIQHEGVITEVILQYIRSAEFLIADLSGERPNVYYEVGYAHAVGKRPILFRREGVRLHFDLSVHNVPEYQSVRELKALLAKRLEAMTGRKPQSPEY
jgi:hypothetical protein